MTPGNLGAVSNGGLHLLDSLPPGIRKQIEEQQALLRQRIADRDFTHHPKPRRRRTDTELLRRARINPKVVGRNKVAVDLANADPGMLQELAKAIGECNGVVVDPDSFRLSPSIVRVFSRLYSLESVKQAEIRTRNGAPPPRLVSVD